VSFEDEEELLQMKISMGTLVHAAQVKHPNIVAVW